MLKDFIYVYIWIINWLHHFSCQFVIRGHAGSVPSQSLETKSKNLTHSFDIKDKLSLGAKELIYKERSLDKQTE